MNGFITEPDRIEKNSMEIINATLASLDLDRAKYSREELQVVKRVIHTTADFDYAGILEFQHGPIKAVVSALRRGLHLVTDTRMAQAGINKQILSRYGVEVRCFMAEEEVAREAKKRGITRAMVSMEIAARDKSNGIFVIGNAPTALWHLLALQKGGIASPDVIIGVPVGFVGAAESKELLAGAPIPAILTRGRKGGSNVAAAIVNAILYLMEEGQP